MNSLVLLNIVFQVIRFFESSPKRTSVLTAEIERTESKEKKLKQLCRTRWVERIASYQNLWNMLVEVFITYISM